MKKPRARRPTPPRRQIQQPAPHPSEDGRITHMEAAWAGPLPPPAILDQFNHVTPNGAERIFQQWESETAHRQAMERTDLKWSIFEAVFGKVLAFLFVIAAFGLAGYAAYLGAEWLSGFLAVGTIAGVVWAFVKANRTRKQ